MKHLPVLFLFLFLSSCSSDKDTITQQEEEIVENELITLAYKVIDGVDQNLLDLDIYYYSDIDNPKPIVIWVHGGGWSIGDKANQIDDKVSLFRSLDYVFVSLNYRLSPFPLELDNPNRIMFPTHNTDIADAIKWVYDNIDQYGGDPDKLALLGHSAGAHLVALTGTNSTFLEHVGLSLDNIKGVAAIDTEGYDVSSKVEEGVNLYINAFGTDKDNHIEASPILHVEAGITYPNFFIAKRGSTTRIAIADQFIEKLVNNGFSVSQVDGSIYDHEGINEAIGATNETLVTEPLKDFFAQCFK